MSHPDPGGPPDLTPIEVGDILDNPVTGERSTTLELLSLTREAVAQATLRY
ncbi:MAG: hypothetical protein ABSH36_09800 [Solirubrobacteraceae bacterium]